MTPRSQRRQRPTSEPTPEPAQGQLRKRARSRRAGVASACAGRRRGRRSRRSLRVRGAGKVLPAGARASSSALAVGGAPRTLSSTLLSDYDRPPSTELARAYGGRVRRACGRTPSARSARPGSGADSGLRFVAAGSSIAGVPTAGLVPAATAPHCGWRTRTGAIRCLDGYEHPRSFRAAQADDTRRAPRAPSGWSRGFSPTACRLRRSATSSRRTWRRA